MNHEIVTLKLPRSLLKDAGHLARAQDVTIGHLVRHLLTKEVERAQNPKTPKRTDNGLRAALQALLSRDMAEATSWADLANRLRRHGYDLRPARGGTVLFKTSCGTRMCKGAELGFPYQKLVTRFGCPMPGHPQTDLDQRPIHLLHSTVKGRLQRELEPVFKSSTSWPDLSAQLAARGFFLRPMGRGTAIYRSSDGRHVCNTKTVGYRYRALVKRFNAPMPGHPHGETWVKAPPAEPTKVLEFEVIERG